MSNLIVMILVLTYFNHIGIEADTRLLVAGLFADMLSVIFNHVSKGN